MIDFSDVRTQIMYNHFNTFRESKVCNDANFYNNHQIPIYELQFTICYQGAISYFKVSYFQHLYIFMLYTRKHFKNPFYFSCILIP